MTLEKVFSQKDFLLDIVTQVLSEAIQEIFVEGKAGSEDKQKSQPR